MGERENGKNENKICDNFFLLELEKNQCDKTGNLLTKWKWKNIVNRKWRKMGNEKCRKIKNNFCPKL